MITGTIPMFFNKKVRCDYFLLALLVVHLHFDFDFILNENISQTSEVQEEILGSNSVSNQASLNLNILDVNRKSWEADEQDIAPFLFNRFNFNTYVRRGRNDFIAYHSSLTNNHNRSIGNTQNTSDSEPSSWSGLEASVSTEETLHERDDQNWSVHELTIEDINLIEILWKQDIDLGVSREAFDPQANVEVEDVKNFECSKGYQQHQDFDVFGATKSCLETRIKENVPSSSTVDSETGELIPEENPVLYQSDSSGALLSEEPLIFSHLDSFPALSFENDVLSADIFYPQEFPEQTVESNEDPVFSFPQLDKVEKELEAYIENYQSYENDAGDVFSTVGDCWAGSPVVLPFSGLGASDSNASNFRSRPQDRILHAAALESPSFEEPFYSIPALLGPSSVGCVFAESLATLLNDNDPIPTGSLISSISVPQIPELMQTYQTISASHNELSMNELFTEDLQLSSKSSEMNPRILCADQIDSSNNSESLSSGRMPLLSDCEENSQETRGVPFSHSIANWEEHASIKREYPQECLSGSIESLSSYSGQAPNIFSLNQNHSYSWSLSSDAMPTVNERTLQEELTHKDEKRARELNIPISIDDIVHLAIEEYNERLAKFELTDEQLNLIRDIRRRGKNKVAAQNCRKRKMDQISSLQQDLAVMHNEKFQLKSKQKCLEHQKHLIEEKYVQLHQIVSQFTNSESSNSVFLINADESLTIVADSDLASGDEFDCDRKTKTKRKCKK